MPFFNITFRHVDDVVIEASNSDDALDIFDKHHDTLTDTAFLIVECDQDGEALEDAEEEFID